MQFLELIKPNLFQLEAETLYQAETAPTKQIQWNHLCP